MERLSIGRDWKLVAKEGVGCELVKCFVYI